MNCETARAHIDDHLDGALGPERAAFEAHIETCLACAAELAAARSLARALSAYPLALPDEGFEARVLERAKTGRRISAPRAVALAFIAAFAATVLTIIFTGLLVEAPRTELAAGLPTVAMVVDQTRTVNLVFASSAAADDVSMTITLPPGVEMLGREGEKEVRWRTKLAAGNNILPLTLVASAPTTGQLVARLERGGKGKVFRVHVTVNAVGDSTG